ncbi:UNVERIFIED_CONTAM: hypothetical protein ABIE34_000597 [Jeotgalibacillus campisalis]
MISEDAALPAGWRMSEPPRSSLPAGWSFKGFEEESSWLGDDVLNAAETAVLPPGCDDSVWILHNQYVCPPDIDPGPLGDDDNGPIYPVAPPTEFVRFTWGEVANIKGVPLRGDFRGLEVPPCFRWEAMLGWDEAGLVVPGAEFVYQPLDATIGQVELEALLPLLRTATRTNRVEGMFSYIDRNADDISGLVVGPDGTMRRRVFSFELEALLPALLQPGLPNRTPEFWWPEDRAWVVWTDWDLLGSKVFGSKKLIETLRSHPDLETLDWFPAQTHPQTTGTS